MRYVVERSTGPCGPDDAEIIDTNTPRSVVVRAPYTTCVRVAADMNEQDLIAQYAAGKEVQ